MSNGLDTTARGVKALQYAGWLRELGFFGVAAYLIWYLTAHLDGKLDTIISTLQSMAHK